MDFNMLKCQPTQSLRLSAIGMPRIKKPHSLKSGLLSCFAQLV